MARSAALPDARPTASGVRPGPPSPGPGGLASSSDRATRLPARTGLADAGREGWPSTTARIPGGTGGRTSPPGHRQPGLTRPPLGRARATQRRWRSASRSAPELRQRARGDGLVRPTPASGEAGSSHTRGSRRPRCGNSGRRRTGPAIGRQDGQRRARPVGAIPSTGRRGGVDTAEQTRPGPARREHRPGPPERPVGRRRRAGSPNHTDERPTPPRRPAGQRPPPGLPREGPAAFHVKRPATSRGAAHPPGPGLRGSQDGAQGFPRRSSEASREPAPVHPEPRRRLSLLC